MPKGNKKSKGKDFLQTIIENRIIQFLGIVAIAYFLLQLFGVKVEALNIVFQFVITVLLVTFGVTSFFKFIEKKLNNLKIMVSDIKAIKSLKKNFKEINEELKEIKTTQKTISQKFIQLERNYEYLNRRTATSRYERLEDFKRRLRRG